MYKKEWVGGQKTDVALKEMKSNEEPYTYRCGSPIYRALIGTWSPVMRIQMSHVDIAHAYRMHLIQGLRDEIHNSPTDAKGHSKT